jgi:hypothetical protein
MIMNYDKSFEDRILTACRVDYVASDKERDFLRLTGMPDAYASDEESPDYSDEDIEPSPEQTCVDLEEFKPTQAQIDDSDRVMSWCCQIDPWGARIIYLR